MGFKFRLNTLLESRLPGWIGSQRRPEAAAAGPRLFPLIGLAGIERLSGVHGRGLEPVVGLLRTATVNI